MKAFQRANKNAASGVCSRGKQSDHTEICIQKMGSGKTKGGKYLVTSLAMKPGGVQASLQVELRSAISSFLESIKAVVNLNNTLDNFPEQEALSAHNEIKLHM